MKRRMILSALAFVILAALIVTTQSSSAVAPDGSSASGQGDFAFFNGVTTEQWSYSFEAAANQHRKTHGRAVFNILENLTETQVVVKIQLPQRCFRLGPPRPSSPALFNAVTIRNFRNTQPLFLPPTTTALS